MSSGDLISDDHEPAEQASNEVQFALVIARMIDTVNNSPEHMRQIVYEVARGDLTRGSWHGLVSTVYVAYVAAHREDISGCIGVCNHATR